MITNVTITNKPTRRALLHQSTRDEILDAARRQIAARGVAALSLRAIAREMRMTPPALYRYFASRDALIAALATAAFRSFADTLQAARDTSTARDPAQRFLDIGLAYRKWALAHPQDYMFIFATPIPDFQMEIDTVTPEARRALGILINVIAAGIDSGLLHPPQAYRNPSAKLRACLARWKKMSRSKASTVAIHLALVVWSRVHGLVSLELVGQLPGMVGDAEELYRHELIQLGRQLGIAKGGK